MASIREALYEEALNDENYNAWRQIHRNAFGEIFSLAFSENTEGQIRLTAALIKITQREFPKALAKLQGMEKLCTCDYDRAVIAYFTGFTCEMQEDEAGMCAHYAKASSFGIPFRFPLQFHPYFRTANLAHKDGECSKAIFYFQKALAFYDPAKDANAILAIGQLMYSIATVYLYMHRYDACERYLELSQKYSPAENPQRTYITAVLYAAEGRADEARQLVAGLNPQLQFACKQNVNAILTGKDLHYCALVQDRTHHTDFWEYLAKEKQKIEKLTARKKAKEAGAVISAKLSETMSFTQKPLACRVEATEGGMRILCKNYSIRTLMAEYDALFSVKPESLANWEFVSLAEFGGADYTVAED